MEAGLVCAGEFAWTRLVAVSAWIGAFGVDGTEGGGGRLRLWVRAFLRLSGVDGEGYVANWVFVATVFATVFCAAVNLYTWVLAYPLWAFAGNEFAAVHQEYLRRLLPVITVPHVVMFFASAAGCWWRVMPAWACWGVFGLDTAVIAVSVGVAGPVHDRFARVGFNAPGLGRLVWVSGLRSLLMVGSCAMLGWVLLRRG